jgi:hypothetical protein
MLTTHPLLMSKVRKSWAIPPLTLWVLLDLLRGSLLYITHLYSNMLQKTKLFLCKPRSRIKERCTDALILILDTSVVSPTPQRLQQRGKSPRYAVNRKLCRPI